jgi:hypothetical protein
MEPTLNAEAAPTRLLPVDARASGRVETATFSLG